MKMAKVIDDTSEVILHRSFFFNLILVYHTLVIYKKKTYMPQLLAASLWRLLIYRCLTVTHLLVHSSRMAVVLDNIFKFSSEWWHVLILP